MTALPPAETVMHLVRAACGVVAPSSACIWPSCNCLIGVQRNDILTALIAAAKAEEREECAKVANDIGTTRWHGTQLEDACDEVAAAIRSRAPGGGV